MFVTVSYILHSLNLQTRWGAYPISGVAALPSKIKPEWMWPAVASDKHSSLLRYRINCSRKKSYVIQNLGINILKTWVYLSASGLQTCYKMSQNIKKNFLKFVIMTDNWMSKLPLIKINQLPDNVARWQNGSQIFFATFTQLKVTKLSITRQPLKLEVQISTDLKSLKCVNTQLTKFENYQILLYRISHRTLMTTHLVASAVTCFCYQHFAHYVESTEC